MSYLIDGLSYGMLLFLFAAGFTLIFGFMNIVNIAHGSFYILGGYVAVWAASHFGNFFIGLITGGLAVAVFGMALYRGLLYRVSEQHQPQILLTFGFVLIISELVIWVWRGLPLTVPKPSFLTGTYQFAGDTLPIYRLALIAIGLVFAVGMWLLLEKTRWGAMMRAGADDYEMAAAVGINVPLLFTVLFGVGSLLSALAGVLGGAFTGVYPGADWEVLLAGFIIVVIGGMGSLKGAFVASVLLGLVETIGAVMFPELAMFLVYLAMALILAIRPRGFFGRA